MTPFRFEHVFTAASPADVLAAYFDTSLQSESDQQIEIVERTVLELTDTDTLRRRVCKVVPKRQLPSFMRALVSGQLHYIETVTWRKADDELDIEIRPSILKGRATIAGVYRLSRVGTEQIQRRYEGTVSVDVALIASRIERGIVAEFEKSIPVTANVMQAWLDRNRTSVSARA